MLTWVPSVNGRIGCYFSRLIYCDSYRFPNKLNSIDVSSAYSKFERGTVDDLRPPNRRQDLKHISLDKGIDNESKGSNEDYK